MKNFTSVGTPAARIQDLSLNPQKLAGQCAKLKCCMNYEVDQYMEASQKLPQRDAVLCTQEGEWFFFKADILRGRVSYSSDKHLAANVTEITAQRAIEIITLNKNGEKPNSLIEGERMKPELPVDLATQEDLNRFDSKFHSKHKKKKKNHGKKHGKPNSDGSAAK